MNEQDFEQHSKICDLKLAIDNVRSLDARLAFLRLDSLPTVRNGICGCQEKGNSEPDANRLEHWIEFCRLLATNNTLEELTVRNCNWNGYGAKLQSSTIESIASPLLTALAANRKLRSLSVSCQILSDHHYPLLLVRSKEEEEENTLSSPLITHLEFTDCFAMNLRAIGQLITSNQSLCHLKINIYRGYNATNREEETSSIQSFISSLSVNTTLLTLEIHDNSLQQQVKEDIITKIANSNNNRLLNIKTVDKQSSPNDNEITLQYSIIEFLKK
ncbi:hypothetical protein PPL_02266 [Heterostelium album PN500]|uniref:Uncharacterized protein n=1 Tax=Heterostelium pallidum (strain ATCC 26659 / Pp 5 / PN500) TaxID=670386 RepID=D3B1U2_HETP5|nr:hypothetical protein PPL_02266 [Heterostelium album PN500]EFA85266.1 hypothetical protein PPL_02266 [Heterostelium album PN500]|eukprot:XP_020437375.1 hypothetical protein PPL_02266 [Heterostelium album PN500]